VLDRSTKIDLIYQTSKSDRLQKPQLTSCRYIFLLIHPFSLTKVNILCLLVAPSAKCPFDTPAHIHALTLRLEPASLPSPRRFAPPRSQARTCLWVDGLARFYKRNGCTNTCGRAHGCSHAWGLMVAHTPGGSWLLTRL
jgi:hypothetical protein